MAEYPYKSKIEDAVISIAERFAPPSKPIREYPLQNKCRADFCFNIIGGGRLFIEDDDASRGLSNLVKYWIWCELNANERPVYVIHIIETSSPASIANIEFIGKKMEKQIENFHYHMITIPNWSVQVETWLPNLIKVLENI